MRRQSGAALLIFLAMILIAVTAVTVSQLSLNAQSINRAKNTTLALSYSKNILLGYALSHSVPGTLPCPDIDNDGRSNPEPDPDPLAISQPCVNYRGLLPYKTLGIARQADGAGQPLWYVVDMNYAGSIVTPHNSSRLANLRIDSGSPLAFILIASNWPLQGQSPNLTLLDVTQFLEGDNADATLNSYSSLKDDTHNDLLLGVTTVDFWSPIEKMVLNEVESLIVRYRTNCGMYPWAADFSLGNGISVNDRYEGAFPLAPASWGTGCAAGILPAGWLSTHWPGQLYYSICNQPLANPPTSSCLSFAGSTQTAQVVVVAPGATRTGQVRDNFLNLNNFFENEDAVANDRLFDLLTPGANDNDLLLFFE